MHELSICQALVSQVSSIAQRKSAQRVTVVIIEVGALSGVEPDLLRAAYPLASAGSIAAHAELMIETPAIRIRCTACGAITPAEPNHLVCGSCGDWRTQLASGDQLILKRVELAMGAAEASQAGTVGGIHDVY